LFFAKGDLVSYWPSYQRHYKFNVPFSVSFTKFRYFKECERRYALHSYGSWDAGSNALGIPINLQVEIKRLKKIDTLDSIAGTAVHTFIANVALGKRNKSITSSLNLLNDAYKKIYNIYEEMKSRAMVVTGEAINGMIPGDNEKILSEIYFAEETKGENEKKIEEKNIKIHAKLESICLNLMKSPVLMEIFSNDTEIKLIENVGFPNIKLFGANIYANIDLAYQFLESKNNIIIDWKTGDPDPESEQKQLLLYALFISEKFFNGDTKEVSDIFYINEYLKVGKRFTHFIDEAKLKDFKTYLMQNIGYLRNKLININSNLPLHITKLKRREHDFICSNCEMRRICVQIDGGSYERI